ncbi:MAG: phage tail tape measure protein [Dehalococcoidia bacterium]|nr:phage tail tape measure protein [Dehalococcoidia bacterium]
MISIGDALLKLGVDTSDLKKGMADASNSVKQSLNDMGAKIRETEKANEESTKNITAAWKSIQDQLRIAGAAFTAVGVAGLKMVSDARQMNADLAQTAITVGTTTKEMRDLALSITDVTFPLNSVIKTLDLLARSGIKDTDVMQKTAKAFDNLGEAVGSPAEVLAELLLPAFKLFGKEIPTTSAELDKFTWLVKNSTVDLSDFGTLLTRMAPYMDKLGLSMEDAIVMLKALSEHGIQGTTATLKLRVAITQAADSGEDLTKILGLTNDELTTYKTQMDGAAGLTDDYATAAEVGYTWTDKLKQKLSELSLKFGTLLTPLEPVLGGVATLGTAMIAVTFVTPKLITAIKAVGRAFVWLVATPAGAIITAIGTIILLVKYLHDHWEDITNYFRGPATVAMEQLQGKIKDLGDEMLATIKKAKTSSLQQWADDQKKAIQGLIDVLQGLSPETIRTFSDEELALIKKADPALAGQLQAMQDNLKALKTQAGLLDEEARKARIIAIQVELSGVDLTEKQVADMQKRLGTIGILLESPKLTPEQRQDLRDEQAELQAMVEGASLTIEGQARLAIELNQLQVEGATNNLQQFVKDNKSSIISGLQAMLPAVDTEMANLLTSWETNYFTPLAAKWDGSVAYVRDFIMPALNNAVASGFSTQGTADEFQKALDNALMEFEKTASQKPWWKKLFTPVWQTGNPFAQVGPEKPLPFWGTGASNTTGNTTINRQFGGTIPGPIGAPVPIMAHGGEEYLGVQNIGRSMGNNIVINLGLLPGDDVTIRRVARAIKDVMGEDGRRNAFAQVNQGYFYGKSAI